MIELNASGLVCLVGFSVLLHLEVKLLLPVELLGGVSRLSCADFLDLSFLLLLVLAQGIALILTIVFHNRAWSRNQLVVKRAVGLV